MIRFDRILICLLAVSWLSGCRKDLCYNHDEHAFAVKVYAVTSWEQEWERPYDYDWKKNWPYGLNRAYDDLRPGIPEGITAKVYDNGNFFTEAFYDTEGGKLPLKEGNNSILMYNNDTEYIILNGFGASHTATATTRTLSRASYQPLHEGERTVNQPDQLYGHFIENYQGVKAFEKVQLPVEMHPLVYTYVVKFTVTKGLNYLALARGAMAGMAEKVYLNDGHTDESAATVPFDCEKTDFGAVAYVKSFGVPNYPGDHYTKADGTPASYKLNLEMKLKNGNLKSVNFDITSQMKGQPRGGVIQVTGIEISDEEGAGGGGFDVDVDGWGNIVDIPVDIN